jgi:uncharacterized protein (DUF2345 family)
VKQLCLAALAAFSLSACVDLVAYTDIATPSHDCAQTPNVAIRTSGGEFTLFGTCARVRVTGSGNIIRIEATDRITVTGNDNTIAIQSVDNITVRGGSDNVVSNEHGLRRTAPNISVLGGNNNNLGQGAARTGGATIGDGTIVGPKDPAEPKS